WLKLSKPSVNQVHLVLFLLLALTGATLFGLPQDIAGGASALLGQDIIGGANVAFKRPPRVRDIAGGASTLLAKRRVARKPPEPTEVSRNQPPRPPQPGTTPTPEPTPKEPTNEEKAETYNDQGNTLYD